MDSIQWQSFLHSCLNILRNGDSKYDGLQAINEFITLITLKLVENRITDETDDYFYNNDNTIKIGNDCKMTYLYDTYCKSKNKDESIRLGKELYDLIYNMERVWDLKQNINLDNLEVLSESKTRNDKKDCILVRFNKYTSNLNKLTDNVFDITKLSSFYSDHFTPLKI
jgi:hypothetical protein